MTDTRIVGQALPLPGVVAERTNGRSADGQQDQIAHPCDSMNTSKGKTA
jgi:hypothetical protein